MLPYANLRILQSLLHIVIVSFVVSLDQLPKQTVDTSIAQSSAKAVLTVRQLSSLPSQSSTKACM